MLFAMLPLLGACHSGIVPSVIHTTEGKTETDSGGSGDQPIPMFYRLTEFQLVRSDNASDQLLQAIMELNAAIREHTGNALRVRSDFSPDDERPFEIVIGKTTRESAQGIYENLNDKAYVIQSLLDGQGMRVVICGGNDMSTIASFQKF